MDGWVLGWVVGAGGMEGMGMCMRWVGGKHVSIMSDDGNSCSPAKGQMKGRK